MNFFLFNLFSTIENAAAIILLLAIFKYRITDYYPQIILTSLTMSIISHSMRFQLDFNSWVPLITIITIVFFIWITFKVSFLYALIISVVGFVAYGLLQTILLSLLSLTGIVDGASVEISYSLEGYILQVFSSITACLISYFIRQKNYGFNWVPYNSTAKFKLKGDNLLLFIVAIISIFVMGLMFFLYLKGYLHLFANLILIFIVLILLFYLARRQETKYYD
jgi:hypothetical protein